VHHKSIIHNKPTRCNSGSIVFIKNFTFWPWNSTVHADLDTLTGFIPTQLMTNTSGCCYII